MNIAIIGTGNVGGALATRFAAAGHHVYLGVRDISDFKGKDKLAGKTGIAITSIASAVKESEVVLISTPAHVIQSVLDATGDLSGKIVIDASNAVLIKPDPFPTAFAALRSLTTAHVVKCFNSTGFENMANPEYTQKLPIPHTVHLDMFMAGDDGSAKAVAKQLALDAGFENCYDFGGDDKVELLEQFALSWINLAIMQGVGRNIAFKVIHRD